MRYNCFRNFLTCCWSTNKNKNLKFPIAAQECQTANHPFYGAEQIVSLKDHDCFKKNMLTYLPWMSVRSVIACLYLLSGTVVCPWWTYLFPMYTHHNLIALFVLNLSFLSILPPSVPRSMKPEPERSTNLSGYAYSSIMHICSPDLILANFCTRVTLASLMCQVWYRGADKSLARPGKKQARKHVRDARDFSSIETRAVIKFFFPPCKARRRRKFTPFGQKH